MDNKVRYMYFGNRSTQRHNGIMTVGYRFNAETKRMEYAVSFCNPNDSFDKKISHRIIDARMTHNVTEWSPKQFDVPAKASDVADFVVKRIATSQSERAMLKSTAKNSDKVRFCGIYVPRWCNADFIADNTK